jgi:hypothetical protein
MTMTDAFYHLWQTPGYPCTKITLRVAYAIIG